MSDDRIAPPPMVPSAEEREAHAMKTYGWIWRLIDGAYHDGWDAAQSRIAGLTVELVAAREQIAALTESCRRETEARAHLQAEHARMVEGAKGVHAKLFTLEAENSRLTAEIARLTDREPGENPTVAQSTCRESAGVYAPQLCAYE